MCSYGKSNMSILWNRVEKQDKKIEYITTSVTIHRVSQAPDYLGPAYCKTSSYNAQFA